MERAEMINLNTERAQLPVEYQKLYDAISKKTEGIIGGTVIDLRSDPTTIRVMLESAMIIVESYRTETGESLSGPEKRRVALTLSKMVVLNLAGLGKIDKASADEIVRNMDFWGGLVIDIAITAANKAVELIKPFINDVKKDGCGIACKKDCCGCIVM